MSAKHSQIQLGHGTKFRDVVGIQFSPSRNGATGVPACRMSDVLRPLPVHPVQRFPGAPKVFREHQRALIFLGSAFFVALLFEYRP